MTKFSIYMIIYNSRHFIFFNSYFIVLMVDLTKDYSKKNEFLIDCLKGMGKAELRVSVLCVPEPYQAAH